MLTKEEIAEARSPVEAVRRRLIALEYDMGVRETDDSLRFSMEREREYLKQKLQMLQSEYTAVMESNNIEDMRSWMETALYPPPKPKANPLMNWLEK